MSREDVVRAASAQFEAAFGAAPERTAYAPGRVNLLGEHTDYNGGVVLPMALSLGTAVAMGHGGEPGTVAMSSHAFEGVVTRSLDGRPDGSWSDYVLGPLIELSREGDLPEGIRIAVASDLPVGSGLSSSAALEVAVLRAASALAGRDMSDVDIALMARRAENAFVGVPCGIMDQYSVSVGAPGKAVFLDTRTLRSEVVDTPASHAFVVVHSGVGHRLGDGGYETRVRECAEAGDALGVEMLSDLDTADLDRIGALPAPLNGRARHIVTENDRVRRAREALKAGDLARFAAHMQASHASQRDDYAVSVPEVDALVEGSVELGADAARLTGGGFGGSIVALVAKDRVEAFTDAVVRRFPDARVMAVT